MGRGGGVSNNVMKARKSSSCSLCFILFCIPLFAMLVISTLLARTLFCDDLQIFGALRLPPSLLPCIYIFGWGRRGTEQACRSNHDHCARRALTENGQQRCSLASPYLHRPNFMRLHFSCFPLVHYLCFPSFFVCFAKSWLVRLKSKLALG